jgi:hypothetical protein
MKKNNSITQSREQGTVTILQGQVPVIIVQSHDGASEATMAVNFLRSGCPQIQLVLENGTEAPERQQRIADLLLAIQLPTEMFWLFGKVKAWSTDKPYTVLTFQDKNRKIK